MNLQNGFQREKIKSRFFLHSDMTDEVFFYSNEESKRYETLKVKGRVSHLVTSLLS